MSVHQSVALRKALHVAATNMVRRNSATMLCISLLIELGTDVPICLPKLGATLLHRTVHSYSSTFCRNLVHGILTLPSAQFTSCLIVIGSIETKPALLVIRDSIKVIKV